MHISYLVIGGGIGGSINTWADGLIPIDVDEYGDPIPKPSVDEWHHFAFTYDGQNQRIFIDGMMVKEVPTLGSVTHNLNFNQRLNIGARYEGDKQFVEGFIDEVRIWNRARTPIQLQETYKDTLGRAYYTTADSGLVGYWRFDVLQDLGAGADGADDVWDFSIHRNHGDLIGGATLVPSEIPVYVNTHNLNVPAKIHLAQNFPNPFNSSTNISYTISNSNFVTLKIYDILGREIQILVNEFQNANIYEIYFDANKLSTGIYFYKLEVGSDFTEIKKMVLIR